ncbi:hypothetical protein DdX_19928 [Ditylenchus destructor]|uniref:Uncharacterized protein n=1 Tax=Ditylenchus destructor TaxID=166010 RepID=A0AAD4QWV4_9BILA|nr:hypothetical protein DdX_19928 [Ditylenchus destructor]
MLLPLDVLLEVLRFRNRNALEFASITNRSMNQVVNKYFRSEPYRVQSDMILGVMSILGKLRFFFYNVNYQAISMEFRIHSDYSYEWTNTTEPKISPSLHYSFEVMRPFLRPYVRIPRVHFWIDDSPYAPGDVAVLAEIKHIWQFQDVSIDTWELPDEQFNEIKHIVADSADLLLNTQYFRQCNSLKFDNIHYYVKLCKYPVIYDVKVLQIRSRTYEARLYYTIIDVIANKVLYGESTLEAIVMDSYFRKRRYTTHLLKSIRKDFLAASVRNNFRLLVPFRVSNSTPYNNDPFWLSRNNTTKEVLESKEISADDMACYVNDEYYIMHKYLWNMVERRNKHT